SRSSLGMTFLVGGQATTLIVQSLCWKPPLFSLYSHILLVYYLTMFITLLPKKPPKAPYSLRSAVAGSYVSGTYSIVFVNCPNEQIARDIARASLDKKLAASVNILPKASSLYFWNGEIEEATEILLLIKTKTSKVHALSSYIRLVHPFEIPEVFSLPMDQGDVHYFKWLEEGVE
uniref:CutA divalent cation tolerance-like protein n=1 Tax=Mustela putorius furo TaxID=9669 RepID=M3Y8F4_MUSPF